MIIVRKEQYQSLQEEKEKELKERFASQLRRDFPEQVICLTADELSAQVSEGYEAAQVLKIVGEENIYRFLKFRYLPTDALESESLRNAFYITITDLEIDAARRLEFIERHVVNRNR